MEYTAQKMLPILNIDRIYTAFVSNYDQSFSFAGEYHEMWELDIILAGNAGITSGTEVYDCSGGTLVIHPANVFHNVWAKDGATLRILTVSFTGKGLEQTVPVGKFVMNESESALSPLLVQAVEAFARDVREEKSGYAERQILKNLLEAFLLSLYQRKNESEKPMRNRSAERFSEIVTYLQEHSRSALTVSDICRAHAIGTTALKELFHNYTGAGVMKYYNAIRVKEALELIEQGHSMAEIAELMHFSSQNYFSSFFKRETGVSPSRYLIGERHKNSSAD